MDTEREYSFHRYNLNVDVINVEVRGSDFAKVSIPHLFLIGYEEIDYRLQWMTLTWPDHYVCSIMDTVSLPLVVVGNQ